MGNIKEVFDLEQGIVPNEEGLTSVIKTLEFISIT
jgi:hypothetical protein